jgi:hypothetical protein
MGGSAWTICCPPRMAPRSAQTSSTSTGVSTTLGIIPSRGKVARSPNVSASRTTFCFLHRHRHRSAHRHLSKFCIHHGMPAHSCATVDLCEYGGVNAPAPAAYCLLFASSCADAPFLEKIAQKIASLAPQTKAIFGITTPQMCSAATDAVVQSNNKAAVAIMAKYNIPTVDMHAAIISQCGPAPNTTCFGQSTCFCPHCPQDNGVGYRWLATNAIVPAIRAAL